MLERSVLVVACLLATSAPAAPLAPAPVRKEALVPAPPAEVWTALTTERGARTFLAPGARIEAVPGGLFELAPDPSTPDGLQGCDGCTVVAAEPGKRLEVAWSFPPSQPELRQSRASTRVTFELRPESVGTRVVLVQTGFQAGPGWEKGRAYFERAWDVVLARLAASFRSGPVDWRAPWTPAPYSFAPRLPSLADVAWLAGSWRGEKDGALVEEHWTRYGGAMAGLFRRSAGGRSQLLEIMSLEDGPTGPALRLRHFSGGLAEALEEKGAPLLFRLVSASPAEAVFEGEGRQAGERLVYGRPDERSLVVVGTFLRNGAPVTVEFRFTRSSLD